MPGREDLDRAAPVVAGAVLGVLSTLLVLATLLASLDGHYVTRREYEATLVGIRTELTYLRENAVQAPARRAPGAP